MDAVNVFFLLVRKFVPSIQLVLTAGLPIALVVGLLAGFVGYLRGALNVRTAYTRKIFHVRVFTLAFLLQWIYGPPAMGLFGSIVCLYVFFAIGSGNGHPFYEALARPGDRPRRTLFIVVPLLTTALGGLASNAAFGKYALVGYLVCGWGDAAGKPVGARWGTLKYRVPSLAGVEAERGLQGSLAVWVSSVLAAFVGFLLIGADPQTAATVAGFVGVLSTVVEALSNHGIDNFTIQFAASGAAMWSMTGTFLS